MPARSPRYIFTLSAILLGALSLVLFHLQVLKQQPDIYLHSQLALKPWGPEIYSHVLYFFILRVASGFSDSIVAVNNAAVVLLTICVVLKYFSIGRLMKEQVSGSRGINNWIIPLTAFLLCMVHAIPFSRHQMMIGYFTANSWHNSTAIMQAPLAVLQFYLGLRLLHRKDNGDLVWLTILVILSNMIKPNFFFCFAPVYTLMVFQNEKYRLSVYFWKSILPIVAGVIVLGIEYLLTYNANTNAGIGLQPFQVWDHLTTNKWLSLAGSVCFPIVYTCVHWRTALKEKSIVFAWLMWITGFVIFILFYEKGERMYHANFIWQMVPATLLLFTSLVIHWLKQSFLQNNSIFRAATLISLFAFLLHVLAGCVYMYRVATIDIW